MNRLALAFGTAGLACALTGASAWAQTKIVEKKEIATVEAGPPRKILVLAIAQDPLTRETFEDVIAGEITLRGGSAEASHLSFPDLPKDRGPFEAKLRELGFDAVMVGHLVGSEDKVKAKEGYTTYATDYQGMDWWGGYVYTFDKVNVPGYLEKESRVRLRTDLWRATDQKGQLVWTGTSETLNPRTATQAAKEVGAAIAGALQRAKLI